MTETTISDTRTPAEFSEARQLFEEYAGALGFDLCFQGFPEELKTLQAMYGPPRGCLLLARRDGVAVGCVGLRPFNNDVCEMKRLYVRPEVRGAHLGRELASRVIEAAYDFGFNKMVLDTLESMEPARRLYRSLGFVESMPYYDNPIEDAVYMELELR